jgi:hypothetical protein
MYVSPPPPSPQQRNLIYVVHGCCTTDERYNNFWVPFRDALRDATDETWQVEAHDWTGDSGDASHVVLDFVDWNEDIIDVAAWRGVALGTAIAEGNYDHVHFIAHSAGSALIATAAYMVRYPDGPKGEPSATSIHTTFLDSFSAGFNEGPWGNAQKAYGFWSTWSEQYFSRERSAIQWTFCPGTQTGSYTQVHQSNSFNVDVSLLDPEYDFVCRSAHEWPPCFYKYSVNSPSVSGEYDPCPAPDDPFAPYGFGLSKAVLGTAWYATVQSYPPDGSDAPGRSNANDVGPEAEDVLRVRQDATTNLAGLPFSSSPNGTALLIPAGVTLTTAGSAAPGEAWITFSITNTLPMNFVRFDVAFNGAANAQGILTGYIDGEEIGLLDERYAFAGTTGRSFSMSTVQPGVHTLAFRLDQFGTVPTSVEITNVATGRATMVSPGDVNVDDQVNADDLVAVILAWGPCPAPPAVGGCPADIAPAPDGDGEVNADDLVMVILNWG